MIRGEINYLPTQPGIGKAPDLAEHKNNILLQTSKSRIHYRVIDLPYRSVNVATLCQDREAISFITGR